MLISIFASLFIVTACQGNEETTKNKTTTVTTETTTQYIPGPNAINVGEQANNMLLYNLDLLGKLIKPLQNGTGYDINDPNNMRITKSNNLFTSTPLQERLKENVQFFQDVLTDTKLIYQELLNNVYYENASFKLNDSENVSVKSSGMGFNDNGLVDIKLEFQLNNNHDFVKKYQFGQDVIIKIETDHETLKLEIFKLSNENVISISVLDENHIELNYQFNQESIQFDLWNLTNGYQKIISKFTNKELQKDVNETITFYGNTIYGSIFYENKTQQLNTSGEVIKDTHFIDYEVFRGSNIGLLYKSMSMNSKQYNGSQVTEQSTSINGFTLNYLTNWEALSITNSKIVLEQKSGNYTQGALNESYLIRNDDEFYATEHGIQIIDFNQLKIYGGQPYYMVGNFIESNDFIDDIYTFDLTPYVPSGITVNQKYVNNVNEMTSDMHQDVLENNESGQFELKKLRSEAHDSASNTTILIFEKTIHSVEVVILDSEKKVLNQLDYDANVSYQDGLLFIYGKENLIPYLELNKINQAGDLITETRYTLDYLIDHRITGIVYNKQSKQITIQYNEGNSSFSNTLEIHLESNETKFNYEALIATYTDPTTQSIIKLYRNNEGLLFLMIYDGNELIQVSSGRAKGAVIVSLTGYKIQNNQLILFGQNDEKPYFFVPKLTNNHTIDYSNTLSFTYYLEGIMTDINFNSEDSIYQVEVTLSNQSSMTLEIGLDGKEVSELMKLGYLVDWSSWNPLDPKFNKLTHVNYSFAYIGDQYGNVKENFARAHQISVLKANNPQLKVIVSIGGWGAGYFSESAATDANRKQFSKTAIELMQKYDFDGIDLDWEYPGSSAAGISSSPNDKYNFTLMLKQLREDLDVLEFETGRTYELSIAAGAFMSSGTNTQLTEIIKYLDYINVMTYDMERSGYTSHHTNLFTSSRVPGQVGAATYIERFIANGVPAKKLALGIAFYGRGGQGITSTTDGLYVGIGSGNRLTYTYTKIKNELLTDPSYTKYWDEEAQAPYLYNGNIFIGYDDPRSILAKLNYAKEMGLGGVFFWQFEQDQTGDLINAIDQYSK